MYLFNQSGRKRRLTAQMSGVSIAALTIFITTGAVTPVAAQDGSAAGGLDEIVVVAKKRSQNLQDVPIAITAVNAEAMESAGIQTTEDLTIVVPGLNVTRQLNAVAPILRGVGNYSSSPGFEGAVATYVDEVYLPSAYGGMFSLANIEQVEVLRGPQGTLFGRNATGGLIHIITKTPDGETAGKASVSYGSQDTVEGKLYATTGITDNIAGDISGFYRNQGKGFGENIFNGNDVLIRDEVAIRSKLVFDYNSSKLVLSADYNDAETDMGIARRPLGDSLTYGPFLFAGGPPTTAGAPSDHYDINVAGDPNSTTEQWGVSAHFTQEFNGMDLVAIASHRDVENTLVVEQSDGPVAFIPITAGMSTESNSLELRLQSNGTSSLDWTLGGYYFGSDDAFDPLTVGGPGVIGATAMAPGGPFGSTVQSGLQETTSLAVFGEATYAINDLTNITGGIRYTSDKKDYTQQTTLITFPAGAVIQTPVFTDSETFKEPSWRVTLDRNFGEGGNQLVYATIAHGFKSGLYNTASAGPDAGPVNPEILDSYEIGFKSIFADNRVRLNAAAFFYEYDDLQLTTQVQGTSVVRNAAEAESKGFELEMQAAMTDELDLNFTAAYVDTEFKSFDGAELTTPNQTVPPGLFPPCPGSPPGTPLGTPNCSTFGSAAGNELPRAPKLTFSAGANYKRSISIGELGLGANVFYSDDTFQDFGNRVSIDSYTLVNANASLGFGDEGQYKIRLSGTNLTDAEYFSYATATAFGDLGAAAPGRQYKVSLEYEW